MVSGKTSMNKMVRRVLMGILASLSGKVLGPPTWWILLYHNIPTAFAQTFSRQIEYLKNNFNVCTFHQATELLESGPIRQHVLTITFDDGDVSAYDTAMPILCAQKVSACVFAVPAYIKKGVIETGTQALHAMTVEHLREWTEAGNEVGSHTWSHVPLPYCSDARLKTELMYSKHWLEDKIGREVRDFAYPYGFLVHTHKS